MFRGSEVQGSKVQGFRGSGFRVQRFRGSEVPFIKEDRAKRFIKYSIFNLIPAWPG
jgi:hypothetical protein